MSIILTGTSEIYSRGILPARITIKTDVVLFWLYRQFEADRITIKIEHKDEWMYRRGIDNSGGKYEVVETYTHDWGWDRHQNGMSIGYIYLQTWDRSTVFATFKYIAPTYRRGEKEMKCDTIISDLDEKSHKVFTQFIDKVKDHEQ